MPDREHCSLIRERRGKRVIANGADDRHLKIGSQRSIKTSPGEQIRAMLFASDRHVTIEARRCPHLNSTANCAHNLQLEAIVGRDESMHEMSNFPRLYLTAPFGVGLRPQDSAGIGPPIEI